MYRKTSHLHFVGIGGIGMSGIAKILKYQGYFVSGCDLDLEQKSVEELVELGCPITHGHNTPACHDPSIDVLVYSSAVNGSSPEIIAAQQRGIPTIPRALMLAELMRMKYSIGIAGSHGKTTTTSMVSHILIEGRLDPTVIIGGHLKNISAHARLGKGDFLVAETDESDRSFLYLYTTLGVVTNIDLEHLETYTDMQDIKETFKKFLNNLPFYGKAIVCVDDEQVRSLLPMPHIKTIKYGLEDNRELADIYATNITLQADHSTFTIFSKADPQSEFKELGMVTLAMPGRHNILNSLAATTVALELGVSFDTIATALATFKGVDRRFSFKGTFNGAELFDDYGHHPNEIYNTLLVAKRRAQKKLTVVFQPHRFTRTHKLWDSFIDLFAKSDLNHLIITDIHAAHEQPIDGITAEKLAMAIKERNPACLVSYVPLDPSFSQISAKLVPLVAAGDLVLLQGAGKINKLAEKLCP